MTTIIIVIAGVALLGMIIAALVFNSTAYRAERAARDIDRLADQARREMNKVAGQEWRNVL